MTVISQRRKSRHREDGGLPRVTRCQNQRGFKWQNSRLAPGSQPRGCCGRLREGLSRWAQVTCGRAREEGGGPGLCGHSPGRPCVVGLGVPTASLLWPHTSLGLPVSLGFSANRFSELRAWPWEGTLSAFG